MTFFVRLTGAQLRNRLEPEKGIFIAESPTVIEVALGSGYEPISMLTDTRLLGGDVDKIIKKFPHSWNFFKKPPSIFTEI